MPAYSYRERFVPLILDLSKTQTIRKRRKYPAKPGDTLYHYFGIRTKWCRKLRQSICKKVVTIFITKGTGDWLHVYLFDKRLSDKEIKDIRNSKDAKVLRWLMPYQEEKDKLAWLDGFRLEGSTFQTSQGSFELMSRWWKQTHQLPFVGDLILWDKKTFVHHKKK